MNCDGRHPLDAAFAGVAARLEALAAGTPAPATELPDPAGLGDLAGIFGLDPVASDLLLCAAAGEVDAGAGAALVQLNATGVLTVEIALTLCGTRAGDALAASAPLRRWRLVELAGPGPHRLRRIEIDERILDHLQGRPGLDPRLIGLVRPLQGRPPLPGPLAGEAERVAQALLAEGPPPVLIVEGGDAERRRAVVGEAAARAGAPVLRLDTADLPTAWTERHATALFLDRELALCRALLLIEANEGVGPEATALIDRLLSPVALAAPEAGTPEREPVLRVLLPEPTPTDRRTEWRAALGEEVDGAIVDRLATQFALPPQAIRHVAAEAGGAGAAAPEAWLWEAARRRSRGPLDGLAERIDARVGWDDLVVPPDTRAALEELTAHQRHAWRISEDWGWAAKGDRGLGTAALFAGASGTGKTLAAEIIAAELGLDLYRIDLSRVVSKYIGETEKNLSRIFAAAETGGAILLFDEADALFGKRSEVKDSHDRYANVEVCYLLQRMEAYRGLAILTTNQRAAVDRAFLRRLRQVVVFPFPDAAARAEIWARIFPAGTPLNGIDPTRLARLAIAGGTIRSIALNAAFLAAAEDGPVRTAHLQRAARREYAKLEKPFTATEAEVFR